MRVTAANYLLQAFASYKGTFIWLSWHSYLSAVILRPVALVIIFGLLGRFAADEARGFAFFVGISVYTIPMIIFGGVMQSFTTDRLQGTLTVIFSSPGSRLLSFCSRPVLHLPNGALSFLSSLLTGWLLLHPDFSAANWGGIALLVLVVMVSSAAFATCAGIAAMLIREFTITFAFFYGILLVFSGVIMPLDVFPRAVQELARLLPLTNGLDAVRQLFAGAATADVLGLAGREALVAVLYAALGYWTFRFVELRLKRLGMLDLDSV